MNDLIEFLTARFGEDEAIIRRNLGKAGLGDDGDFPDYRTYDGANLDAACDYLAHFAPPRQLREVQAKRAIIESCAETLAHEDAHDYQLNGGTGEEYNLARYVLMQLGMPYRDHPDWREDWAA